MPNPYEETYEDLSLTETIEPEEHCTRAKNECDDLDFEEEILRELEREEREQENRQTKKQT